MKKFSLLLPALILLSVVLGCDPAVEFMPRDWKHIDGHTFTGTYDGFDITMGRIGDLIGMERVSAHGCIYNRGKSPAKFEIGKTTLKTGTGEYQGIQNFLNENEIKTIVPGSCQPFDIKFEFNKSLDKALKEPVEINMTVKRGTESTEIVIPMVNQVQENPANSNGE